jgi:hypothetical protein
VRLGALDDGEFQGGVQRLVRGIRAQSTARLVGPAAAAKRSASPSRWALSAMCLPLEGR